MVHNFFVVIIILLSAKTAF